MQKGFPDPESVKKWSYFQNGDIKAASELKGKEYSINAGKDKVYLSDGEAIQTYMLLRQAFGDVVMRKKPDGTFDPNTGTELNLAKNKALSDRQVIKSFRLTEKDASDIIGHVEKNKDLKQIVSTIDSMMKYVHNTVSPTYTKVEGIPLGKRANFFPIFRNMKEQLAEPGFNRTLSAKFGRQRVPGSKTPMEIGDVLDHSVAYLNSVSNYHGYSVPIRNSKIFFGNVEGTDSSAKEKAA